MMLQVSEPRVKLNLIPITIGAAKEFVREHHRHHKPPVSGLFAVACEEAGHVVGVAIVGRPVSRMLSDGYTAEVTRLCTTGMQNACSILYAAAWSLGYKRLVTYILKEESGGSLVASGWRLVGEAGGGKWSRSGDRARVDDHPTGMKKRYQQEVVK